MLKLKQKRKVQLKAKYHIKLFILFNLGLQTNNLHSRKWGTVPVWYSLSTNQPLPEGD